MKEALRILTLGAALALAGVAAIPSTATAHVVECYGDDTEQGLCLIVCHQTHRISGDTPHECYSHNNSRPPPPPPKTPAIPDCDNVDVIECAIRFD